MVGKRTEKHFLLGNAPHWGLVWTGGQMDRHPTPLQPLLRLAPGWHHHLSHGFWGGGCSYQMCMPASGWEFGMGVVWECSQDASHRGNSHVKRDQTGQTGSWGPSACTALLQPCSLSGNSFRNTYIYKIKSYFIYIYLCVLSPWIPFSIHPSPWKLGACAQLRSCRPVVKRF